MESLVFKTQSERNIGKQRRSRSCGNYLNFGCTDFTCRYIQISAHESGRDDFREDYKREQRYLKGEVTVYLSLVFILLISFAGAMLESASLQNVKNYRRADMTRAVESIFAEYQKELWEVYGIFALEGSYETGSYSEELLKERLAYYGASGMDQEITRIQLLTDQGGISRGRESLIACGEIKKHASCRSDYAKGTCNVKEKYYVIGNGIS